MFANGYIRVRRTMCISAYIFGFCIGLKSSITHFQVGLSYFLSMNLPIYCSVNLTLEYSTVSCSSRNWQVRFCCLIVTNYLREASYRAMNTYNSKSGNNQSSLNVFQRHDGWTIEYVIYVSRGIIYRFIYRVGEYTILEIVRVMVSYNI